MDKEKNEFKSWKDLRIGITGASGALGSSLAKDFREAGSYVIGLTSKKIDDIDMGISNLPHEWVKWQCGEEKNISNIIKSLDILILNHGINYQGNQNNNSIINSIEINALSIFRFIELIESFSGLNSTTKRYREIWINTSEAEIQPALSPTYELSKRLIGQIISIKMRKYIFKKNSNLKIRKIILGPFKSRLNPIGILNSETVSKKIVKIGKQNSHLIIITPNPITYLIIPINEYLRYLYYWLTEKI